MYINVVHMMCFIRYAHIQGLGLLCLTPLSTIFQLYSDIQKIGKLNNGSKKNQRT